MQHWHMSIQGLYNDLQRPWAAIINEMKILMPLRNNGPIFLNSLLGYLFPNIFLRLTMFLESTISCKKRDQWIYSPVFIILFTGIHHFLHCMHKSCIYLSLLSLKSFTGILNLFPVIMITWIMHAVNKLIDTYEQIGRVDVDEEL